jgi:hypothetical protein
MGLGKDSYWQVAEEVTPGTFVPPIRKSEMISEGLEIDVDEIPDPSLHPGRSARAIYAGARRMRGPLEMRMNFQGALLKLIKGVLGSASSSLVGGETIVRDHGMFEGTTLPSLSLEVSKGDIPTGKVLRGTGVRVASLALSGGVGADAMGRARAEFLGIDLDPNTGTDPAGFSPTTSFIVAGGGGSGGSPVITTSNDFIAAGVAPGMPVSGTGVGAGAIVVSITSATSITVSVNNSGAVSGNLTFTLALPAILPVIGTQVITLNNGVDAVSYPGGALRARRWSVTMENPLAERLFLGSVQPDVPLLENQLRTVWEFEEEFQTLKHYQAARLYTDTAPKIIFQDPTTIGSTSKREFEIRSNKAKAKYGNPVEGYGLVRATVRHTAYYDATDLSSVIVRVRSLDGGV